MNERDCCREMTTNGKTEGEMSASSPCSCSKCHKLDAKYSWAVKKKSISSSYKGGREKESSKLPRELTHSSRPALETPDTAL